MQAPASHLIREATGAQRRESGRPDQRLYGLVCAYPAPYVSLPPETRSTTWHT